MKRLLMQCSPVYLPQYLLRIRDETVGKRSTCGPLCAVIDVNRICALSGFYAAQEGTQPISGVPRNFVRGGRGSTNSVEDRGQREWGSGGGSQLVRGSGGSCNLVKEISLHIVKFS